MADKWFNGRNGPDLVQNLALEQEFSIPSENRMLSTTVKPVMATISSMDDAARIRVGMPLSVPRFFLLNLMRIGNTTAADIADTMNLKK